MNTPESTNILDTRPTKIEVNLSLLSQNYQKIKAHVKTSKVMAVLKANAYGHGLIPCAKYLESLGADYFGVAFLEEGIFLRTSGIKTPILVFGGISNEQIQTYLQYDLDICAPSVEKLQQIEETAKLVGKRAKVHIKIDTGMERIGVHYYSAENLLKEILKLQHTEITGIFSHLARAEEADNEFTRLQLERFLSCLEFFPKHSLPLPLRHLANSAATLKCPETHLDMVRPGISLYGIMPDKAVQNSLNLAPLLSLKTKIVYFKVTKAGHGVSYGHSFVPQDWTRIVTLPIGYGDGYFRALSSKASVLIRGKHFPIVGKICMDQMMINIGRDEAFNNEEVVLIGTQENNIGNNQIGVNDLAELAQTIPYEILTNLNTRLPRIYLNQ